jgi:hypothetical protein
MVNRGTDTHFRLIRNVALIVRKRKRYMGVKGKGKGKGELVKIFGLADCSDQLISDSILRFSSAATGEMPSLNV